MRNQWLHTSSQMALLANCHRDPKKAKAYTPDYFDPFEQKKTGDAKKLPREAIASTLVNVFAKGK